MVLQIIFGGPFHFYGYFLNLLNLRRTLAIIKSMSNGLRASLFLLFSFAVCSGAGASEPSSRKFYQNLSKKELKARMKYFAKSLGVKCKFCHLKDKKINLSEKITDPRQRKILGHKERAREMIRMVHEINSKFLNWKHGSGRKADQIDCMFCHQGHKDRLEERRD